MWRDGLFGEPYTIDGIIHMLRKSGELHDDMTYMLIINAYLRVGRYFDAKKMYIEMAKKGIFPQFSTVTRLALAAPAFNEDQTARQLAEFLLDVIMHRMAMPNVVRKSLEDVMPGKKERR